MPQPIPPHDDAMRCWGLATGASAQAFDLSFASDFGPSPAPEYHVNMKSLPLDVVHYKSTAVFTESTVPAGLLKEHTTRAGVWGQIVVLEGTLQYRILPTEEEYTLTPTRPGVVEPQVPHWVRTNGPVRFLVEFHKS